MIHFLTLFFFFFLADIPDFNSGDIIIDSTNKNSAVIDTDSAQSLTFSWVLLLSICLSIFNLVKLVR